MRCAHGTATTSLRTTTKRRWPDDCGCHQNAQPRLSSARLYAHTQLGIGGVAVWARCGGGVLRALFSIVTRSSLVNPPWLTHSSSSASSSSSTASSSVLLLLLRRRRPPARRPQPRRARRHSPGWRPRPSRLLLLCRRLLALLAQSLGLGRLLRLLGAANRGKRRLLMLVMVIVLVLELVLALALSLALALVVVVVVRRRRRAMPRGQSD